MKLSYVRDPSLSGRLFELLETVFPGIRQAAGEMVRLGPTWESISTPYVDCENGVPVSHVGLIELPLVLDGRETTVGSVHAVATHPEHRRRGHYGRLMQEVIEDTAGRLDTLILTTGNPEYYEPFGFREVVEHEFFLDHQHAGPGSFRRLDLSDSVDFALIHRLLETREPVSRRLGVRSEKAVFLFNEGRRDILYSRDLDLAACLELNAGKMELFDLVGPKIPPAREFLSLLPGPYERVVFHFSPDRMSVDTVSRSRVLNRDDPSHLMVRGPFPVAGRPVTLPRSART